VPQAAALDELLSRHKSKIAAMICLEVAKEELIGRLLNRGTTSGRCDDTDVTTIENRINVYNEKTAPIISYYQNQHKYHPVMGMGTIEEIAENIKRTIEKL
jgi:adenylate kinase